ncbi:TonB-dependent receptor plug domain-containing protein [Allosphingosinicella vermicomposti]|uniref:TonB-dependent receptor plug domain-containing protein n=1 Tax=Allosphingosinicella vermicomposti TaxID=614671 RepID=UPI000D1086A9|nr:TonB-dependent receptor plug domain-containing protein [Allosphingosinicella vermicomposti]
MKFVSVTMTALVALSAPALAQDQKPAAEQTSAEVEGAATEAAIEGEDDGEAIVVTGRAPRGQVIGDIPPEVTLDARDIRSYGAGNIAELLEELSPQTQSGRGRGGGQPVTLLNGRRISGFQEIRNIPPEALERVEILPEEVALKYGYRADQRVVNFVLRERFRAVTGEVEAGVPTAGGRGEYEVDANYLRLGGDARLSLDAEYERQTALLESERDVLDRSTQPFSLGGNVAGLLELGEIDPALSAAAGSSVTVAAVPGSTSASAPALADFVPGANAESTTDTSPFRTLLPKGDNLQLGATYSRPLGDISATLNARVQKSGGTSLLGLPGVTLTLPAGNPYSPFAADALLYRYLDDNALTRESDSWSGRVGFSLNGSEAPWNWSVTGSYDHSESESLTGRGYDEEAAQARLDAGDPAFNPYAASADFGPLIRDRAKSNSDTTDLEFVTNGPLFRLPAGEVSSTFKAGAETRNLSSRSTRLGETTGSDLYRAQGKVQGNIDIPIASRREGVLDAIGNLSANVNVAFDQLSDFGLLTAWGGGINWSPVDEVRFIASYTNEDGAPSIQQLGDPETLTPNVRVFDFTTGQTVDISRLDGGNPDLLSDNRRVWKLGLNVRPIKDTDLSVSADFIDSRTRNPIASFPTATPEIEAAFPDRFTRDAEGRLLRIDNRPVNFARADRQEIRWGINFSEALEPSASERAAADARRAEFQARRDARQAASGQQGGDGAQAGQRPRGPGGFGGGRGFGRGGGAEGRFNLSLYHTWRLKDEIEIGEGIPVLDLLDGSATGNRGGQARHAIEARAGISKNGLGARLNVNWQSGTEVLADPASPISSAGDLRFADFTKVGLRFFADLGQQRSLVRKWSFLRGSRLSLDVDNVFDARLKVKDANGETPVSYQPDLLDPLGRTVRLSFRKLFF